MVSGCIFMHLSSYLLQTLWQPEEIQHSVAVSVVDFRPTNKKAELNQLLKSKQSTVYTYEYPASRLLLFWRTWYRFYQGFSVHCSRFLNTERKRKNVSVIIESFLHCPQINCACPPPPPSHIIPNTQTAAWIEYESDIILQLYPQIHNVWRISTLRPPLS